MDIKRTIPWVIFAMSLVLLYDNWQRATGHPSMFFPSANQQQAARWAGPPTRPPRATCPRPPAPPRRPRPLRRAAAAAQPAGEQIVVTTDEVRATIDTAGGILSRPELLNQHEKDGKPVVLFERDSVRTYVARSGLIGGDLPNHTTVFTAAPGPRTLGSADTLEVALTADKGGIKLVKTYIFRRAATSSTRASR